MHVVSCRLFALFAAAAALVLAGGAFAQEQKPEKKFDVLIALPGQAEPAKVGAAVEKEVLSGDRLVHTARTKMSIGRGALSQEIEQHTEYVEDKAGKLLEFSVNQTINKNGKLIRGTVDGKTVTLTIGEGANARTRKVTWPDGAITPRAMDKAVSAGLTVGKTMKFSVFPLPDAPENAHDVTVEVLSAEKIVFDGKTIDGFKVKSTVTMYAFDEETKDRTKLGELTSTQWLDAGGDTYRVEMLTGGVRFIMQKVK
jgi:hypothetical protein